MERTINRVLKPSWTLRVCCAQSAMEGVDLSSAEEEGQRRQRVRTKQKRKNAPAAALTLPPPATTVARYDHIQDDELPVLRTISDFSKEYDHTLVPPSRLKPDCESAEGYLSAPLSLMEAAATAPQAASVASGSSSSSTASGTLIPDIQARRKQDHLAACRVVPAQVAIFKRILSQLWQPVFFRADAFQSSQTDALEGANDNEDQASRRLQEALRRRQLTLPVMTATLEQELLAEAGTFEFEGEMYTFPVCMNGERCIANQVEFPLGQNRFPEGMAWGSNPQRFILTSLMYQEEYEAFIREKKPPDFIRPCVACCRHALIELVSAIRYTRACVGSASSSSSSSSSASSSNESDWSVSRVQMAIKREVFQLYRNLVNHPEGYFSEYMYIPKVGGGDEPVIDPICQLSKSSMLLRCTPQGRRYLDQSKIVYSAPQAPPVRIGEPLQVFSRGAGRF